MTPATQAFKKETQQPAIMARKTICKWKMIGSKLVYVSVIVKL
jgi:hypothetical protein